MCQGCVTCVSPLPGAFNFQRRYETKHTSSNFRAKTVGFFMDRYLKDETAAKNFVWNKSSSHSQEKLEKPAGGGGGGWMQPPPPLEGLINL